MKTTIDGAGRIVVPKRMRDRLGLRAGDEIEIEEIEGVVEIRPRSRGVRLVEADDGRGLVLEAPPGTPPMTDDDVRRLIDESRMWPRL